MSNKNISFLFTSVVMFEPNQLVVTHSTQKNNQDEYNIVLK